MPPFTSAGIIAATGFTLIKYNWGKVTNSDIIISNYTLGVGLIRKLSLVKGATLSDRVKRPIGH